MADRQNEIKEKPKDAANISFTLTSKWANIEMIQLNDYIMNERRTTIS